MLRIAGAGLLGVAWISVSAAVLAAAGVPAFPGAEGFGCQTPGGRGGQVIAVTNLNNAGPGSLRAAIDTPGLRTIIFRVAGTIELDSPLQVIHPFVTIAGQTAPGGGITLKNTERNLFAPLQIRTHDVIVRYIRSRPGMSGIPTAKVDGSTVDALTIADPQRDVYNVVVDHCSFSWSVDEVLNVWYTSHDVTVQWCIMSEGLHQPPQRGGAGSKGPLFGGRGCQRISAHHNLLAHNVGRNPMVKALGLIDLVNNVIFVPGTIGVVVDGELGACHVNLVGNMVLAPRGEDILYGARVLGQRPVTLFVQANRGPYRTADDQPEEHFVTAANNSRQRIVSQRGEAPSVTWLPADVAYEQVLAGAGCTLPQRDAVDERIVDDVRMLRTRVVNDPAEVGGWPHLAPGTAPPDADGDGLPDAWELQQGLDPADPADGKADRDADGYTNLEEYLNSL